jgi:hypothetical protein
MKKVVLSLAGVATVVMGLAATPARAGDYCGDCYQKVWCPPVYEHRCRKVWVEPVYETVCKKVWVEPVYETVCKKVWVPPVYCEVPYTYYDHCGRCCTAYKTVLKAPGYYKTYNEQVLVKAGYYDTVKQQVLVKAGYYDTVKEKVLVRAGYWDVRRSY